MFAVIVYEDGIPHYMAYAHTEHMAEYFAEGPLTAGLDVRITEIASLEITETTEGDTSCS